MTNSEIFSTFGIVLSVNKYSESSAICTILTENGREDFILSNVYKVKSNLKQCLIIGNLLEIYYTFKASIKNINSVKVIFDVTSYYSSYEKMLFINYFSQILLLKKKDLSLTNGEFDFYKLIVISLKNSYILNSLLLFLANVIRFNGYLPHTKSCVMCLKEKNIVYFDFETGGFICKDCFNKNHFDTKEMFTSMDLYLLKFAFSDFKVENLNRKLPKDECLKMIRFFDHFIFETSLSKYRSTIEELLSEITY